MPSFPCLRVAAALALSCLVPAKAQAPAPSGIPPASVIAHLEQGIAWYRSVVSLETTPSGSQDVLLSANMRDSAVRALQLAFDFAQADAALETVSKQPQNAAGGNTSSAAHDIQQAATRAADRVTNIQSRITELDAAIANAKPRDRGALDAQRKSLDAQLSLAREIQKTVGSIVAFAGQASGGAAGFAGQIQQLERTVPEVHRATSTNSPASTPAPPKQAAPASAPQPGKDTRSEGLVSLIGDLFSVGDLRGDIDGLIAATGKLSLNISQIRSPVASRLREALSQSDQLSTGTASGVDQINADDQKITALAAQFRQLSTVLVPLGEEQIMIDTVRADLQEWRVSVNQRYKATAHALLVRLGALAGLILFILVVSSVWRRAAFRYVADVRRRRQFLVVRRIVVALAIALVVILSFISEFGAIATYAGLLTAGIALALQNVILSVVAYFFLIGRYGIRVGDRVTISGVNGEVIDMGLVRMYMMELTGAAHDLHPTGRVVVYSNAVLFQPAAIYKQMPGIGYAWHSASLTLTPESNFEIAEKTLTAAVNSVYQQYSGKIEEQHAAFARSVDVQVEKPHPASQLRFNDKGLEFTVRYPVELSRGPETDAQVMQALTQAIEKEPKLTLALAGAPKLDVSGESASS